MQERYEPSAVEADAQHYWDEQRCFEATEDPARDKYYCLSMFPYPSGRLHMGHVRNYTIGDVLSRFMRMNGKNVLQPMGWDAFGLPAENAAMANGVPPAKWTFDNIAHMKTQLKSLGFALDWSRELTTCDPKYYRWNQWLFLRMLEKGIAYQKTGVVNWDPVDKTVLANEQVIDGRGWRTGALVEKREIPMYYLKITAYAEDLLRALDGMQGWPERVRTMQANWIGKSQGVRIGFPYDAGSLKGVMHAFTTRPDTIMGVTFCAVAAEHPLAAHAARANPALAAFIEECKRGPAIEAELATQEKKGMPTGLAVRHPITQDAVPVWVGNYVLMSYGEGAVMGVPAHDERDFEFAKKYHLPISPVIEVPGRAYSLDAWAPWYADHGRCINSGPYDGLEFDAALDAIAADLGKLGLGEKQTTWRLRDWGISRQRYWGCPIPVVHCASCGTVPVRDADLPVLLPDDLVPDGSGNPLLKDEKFLVTSCPGCGGAARRETDTMDTFVDSSWYFLRFACSDNGQAMLDERVRYWLPVDQYIGGIEHAILHLLYARFWTRVVNELGAVGFREPFANLFTQGMVLNEVFFRKPDAGRIEYFNPADVEIRVDKDTAQRVAVLRADGTEVESGGVVTMSKSKNNGVDPQALVDEFGADTARLFTMFAAPPEQTLEWSDEGVQGAYRFIKRLWKAVHEHVASGPADPLDKGSLNDAQRALRRQAHQTLAKVTDDIGRRRTFNTAIASVMELLNSVAKYPQSSAPDRSVIQEALDIAVLALSPIVPHVTHALWRELGHTTALIDEPWMSVDAAALQTSTIELVVQVNGKLRARICVAADADDGAAREAALADPNVRKFVGAAAVRKVIVVPGKLVNVVV
ncbi:MAG: leucyl-tRNA synthetase [Gammaproteobacteria bacterium]|jgi:leucyl-tRNA synthetase|nr:leucyl-tRNA synthetase [Gammaproteobacteria bacterium]